MNSNHSSIVAIGDIHGCSQTLEGIIKKVKKHQPKKWIFIGDYIDRGPNSRETLDFLINFKKNHDAIFLRGNHEQMFLDVINANILIKKQDNSHKKLASHPKSILWFNNGGKQTLQSFGISLNKLEIEDKYIDFLNRTVFFFETEDFFFVHAGVPPDMTLIEAKKLEDKMDFLWLRNHLGMFYPVWEKTLIFGHTPFSSPWVRPQRIGIDTGCVYNEIGYGRLTAVLLPERKYIYHYNIDHVG